MTRRKVWLLAGSLLTAALLAGGVFFASLSHEKELRSLNGPGSLNDLRLKLTPHADLKNTGGSRKPIPGVDPRTQEALETIEEINRINRLNQELRQKTARPAPAAPPRDTKKP